jgi:hypothetical protein
LGVPAYSAIFASSGWVVRGFGCCPSTVSTQSALTYIYAQLTGVVAPTGATTPEPVDSGPFDLGLGCGSDPRLVACTVSVYGRAPDAQLVYEWRLDGQTRAERGSTIEIDWIAERIPTGHHSVGVTVTDTRHNVSATDSLGLDLGLSVTLACSYLPGDSDYAVTCFATPRNQLSTATIEYEWRYDYLDSSGARRSGTDPATDDRFVRSFGRGAVTVTVVARDTANGLESSPSISTLVIDPVATLTEWLTLGQTADPQNVIDALKGVAAGATVAAIAAALGLSGGIGGATKPPPGSAGVGGVGGRP